MESSSRSPVHFSSVRAVLTRLHSSRGVSIQFVHRSAVYRMFSNNSIKPLVSRHMDQRCRPGVSAANSDQCVAAVLSMVLYRESCFADGAC